MLKSLVTKLMLKNADKVGEALDKMYKDVTSTPEEIEAWNKWIEENERQYVLKHGTN